MSEVNSSVPVSSYVSTFVRGSFDQIDYTGRDFQSFKDGIISYLEANHQEYFRNFDDNDPLMMDIEAFSYVGDVLSFYTDRTFNELNPFHAREIENIRNYIDIFNFKRRGYLSAVTTVMITFSPLERDIVLPAGYKVGYLDVETGRNIPYEVFETQLIKSGESSVNAVVTQGETIIEDFGTADGKYFFVKCSDRNYQEASMQLFVNGEEWKRVETFRNSQFYNKHYRVLLNNDYVPYIESGDGSKGLLIPEGAKVTSKWRKSDGDKGNVPAGIITEFIDSSITEFTDVINIEEAEGGINTYTTEETKFLVPGYINAQDRGITIPDIEQLIDENPLFGIRARYVSFDSRFFATSNRHLAAYVDVNGDGEVTEAQSFNLKTYLESKSAIGYVITVYPPVRVAIDVDIYIKLADSTLSNAEMASYYTRLASDYFIKDNWLFKATIRPSDITVLYKVDNRVDDIVVNKLFRQGGTEGVSSIEMTEYELPVLGNLNITVEGGQE